MLFKFGKMIDIIKTQQFDGSLKNLDLHSWWQSHEKARFVQTILCKMAWGNENLWAGCLCLGVGGTYLCPSLLVEHRPSTTPCHRTLFWAALVIPDQLVPCCFSSASVSRLQLLRGRPLFLFPCGFQVRVWRVPGQGLACGAGCWLSEGVSDPAPLPPQYLLGHWFLSRSLPQIFISDLLLLLDFVDAPQTDVEECLDLSLHRLCCPPCLTSVKQDWLHIGVEDAESGSHADSSRCPDVFEHDESCSCLAHSGCDVSVCASLLFNHTSQVDERLHLPYGLSTNCDWCVGSCVHLHQLSLLSVDLEPCLCWCDLQESGLDLHLAVIVWQERQVISEVKVVLAASRVSTIYRCSYLLLWSAWSSRWPGGIGAVKAGTPAGLQSSPRNFQTAGRRGQFCSSCPGRCTGWGRLSSLGLHSVSAASTGWGWGEGEERGGGGGGGEGWLQGSLVDIVNVDCLSICSSWSLRAKRKLC